jgi:predicted RNA binding protein YcfA (HicA-like mRNA interferase family)
MPRVAVAGFRLASQRVQPEEQRITVVPDWSGRDLKFGTIRAAVKQLGLEWTDFQ